MYIYGPSRQPSTRRRRTICAFGSISLVRSFIFNTLSIRDLGGSTKLRGRRTTSSLGGIVVLFVLVLCVVCAFYLLGCMVNFISAQWLVSATVIQPDNVVNDKLASKRWRVSG